jgi:ArsR family transcriptional regulator
MIAVNKFKPASVMLKAIAHPIRISIVEILGKQKKLSVTQIQEYLKIEQAVASHHLSILKNNGILLSERSGKNCFYFLKYEHIAEIIDCLDKCQN